MLFYVMLFYVSLQIEVIIPVQRYQRDEALNSGVHSQP
jgi:hypothetical protein